jgi:hypothetical protein
MNRSKKTKLAGVGTSKHYEPCRGLKEYWQYQKFTSYLSSSRRYIFIDIAANLVTGDNIIASIVNMEIII